MCLSLSQINNKPRKVFNTSWYRELKENGKITCYKILEHYRDKLFSPFQRYYYKPGWNKSNRKSIDITDTDEQWETVVHGIHVYRTKRQAKKNITCYYSSCNLVIIPVVCYLKDLVAMGKDSEAVFMKVFIPKSEICRITKNK